MNGVCASPRVDPEAAPPETNGSTSASASAAAAAAASASELLPRVSTTNATLFPDAWSRSVCHSFKIKHNGLIYCDRLAGVDPTSGAIVPGTVTDQMRQAMTNLSELLERVGSGLEHVVDMKIYLADIEHLGDVSDVMDGFFGQNRPDRRVEERSYFDPGRNVEIDVRALSP